MFDDSVSRYGKSQFELVDETEMEDAVSDSSEQLLTVVNVVMIDEIGAEDAAEDEVNEEEEVWVCWVELAAVDDASDDEWFWLEIVILRLVIVVELDVVTDDDDDAFDVEFVKISLLLNGSKADWDERLNTEPQSILLVLLLSTSSASPNAESLSFTLLLFGDDASDEMPAGDAGKGVARPLLGSFNGWCSYGIGSLNEEIRFIRQLFVML